MISWQATERHKPFPVRFSLFAAFLGAKSSVGPGGVSGALVALIAIFLPGMLLVYGVLPFWDRLRTKTSVRGALNGVNAAVVGVLGAALYEPIWTSTILRPLDAALALLAFAALTVARLPVFVVVAMSAAAGIALTLIYFFFKSNRTKLLFSGLKHGLQVSRRDDVRASLLPFLSHR